MRIRRPCDSCSFPVLIAPDAREAMCTDCRRGKRLNWAKSISATEKAALIEKACYGQRQEIPAPITPEGEEKIVEFLRTCPTHPKYGGVRTPRTDCEDCWAYYEHKHPDRAKS